MVIRRGDSRSAPAERRASCHPETIITTLSLNTLLKHERAILVGGLTVMIALAWAYTVHMDGHMSMPAAAFSNPVIQPWTAADAGTAFMMWTVMMIGMMLPTAAPWVLTLAGLTRKEGEARVFRATGGFVFGYLSVWTGYSLIAVALQWLLHDYGLLSPALDRVSGRIGGAVLILVGVYQFLPVKYACLKHCRSPLHFFLTSWRNGRFGAARMGFHHGLFCVGCCWMLMALSFVAGVMNLLWMAAVTVFIFIDHALPIGKWPGRAVGAVLIAWGGGMIIQG